MMEFIKKYKFEIIAALVILALVILFWVSLDGDSTSTPGETSAEQETVLPPAPPASTSTPSPKPPASPSKPVSPLRIVGKPLPGKTYQEVVETYKDRRIQFDASCRATPNFLTFKNGPEIMFDNRDASEKVIKLDGQGYKIGPYGFVVLVITSTTLPLAVEIDCNQLFNAAIINLQK